MTPGVLAIKIREREKKRQAVSSFVSIFEKPHQKKKETMKITSLLQSLIFLSAGIGFIEGKHAFLPRSKVTHSKRALLIRGGSGLIEPDTAATVYGSLVLAQGVFQTLAPSKIVEAYGYDPKDLNPFANAVSRRAGVATLTCGLYIFALHMQKYSLDTAMLLGSTLWGAEWLYSLLNETKIFGAMETALFGFVLSCTSIYGILTGADWATTALKISAVFALVGGLSTTFLSVQDATSLWKVKREDIIPSPDIELSVIRNQGFSLLTLAIAMYTLIFEEKDILEATGRMAAATVLLIAKALLTNDIPEEQKKTPGPYVWMALSSVVAYSLLSGE